MDMTVTRIGAVVVSELRAAGYLESTIGQYGKTIRALARYANERGGVYSPGLRTPDIERSFMQCLVGLLPRSAGQARCRGSGCGWRLAGRTMPRGRAVSSAP